MMRKIVLCILTFLFSSNISLANIAILPSFADIIEPLIPAVVNVYTTQYKKQKREPSRIVPPGFPFDQFNELFERFEIPLEAEDMPVAPRTSLGSGFVIDAEGYIVTNHHVIDNADEIYIKLGGGKEIKAKLIGSDQRTDLALLKIDSKEQLPFVKFGSSSEARVGDWIIAIGNPFGLGGTVTAGIISSKGRDIALSEAGVIDDYIQTDAAINRGNSGGPMFNMKGEVIGINTAIFAPNSGNNIGIGFAIPSATALSIIDQLKKHGKVSRGLLSIKIQDVTEEIAEGLGLSSPSGALVYDVEEGGAGAKAGLKSGDVILEFNGVEVKNSRKLQIAVAEVPVNSDAKIVVLRNGKKHELICRITEDDKKQKAPNEVQAKINTRIPGHSLEKHGVIFSDISKDLIKFFGLKEDVRGIVVSELNATDLKWKGLVRGDVIVSVNQQPVSSISEFDNIYAEAKKQGRKNIVLLVHRQGVVLFMAMPL